MAAARTSPADLAACLAAYMAHHRSRQAAAAALGLNVRTFESRLKQAQLREARGDLVAKPFEVDDLPTDLPDAWPYTLVESIVAVRTQEHRPTDPALQPLAP